MKYKPEELTELLTINKAKELRGETIQWKAEIYEGNYGFYHMGLDGGVCTIGYVEKDERFPIKSIIREGSDANFFFNEHKAGEMLDAPLCYSDGDRYVYYKIIKEE